MRDEASTTCQQPANQSNGFFVKHKKTLTTCAAAVAVSAVIGTSVVFGAGSLPTTNSSAHAMPVAEITSDQAQQPLPSFADLVERVKPAVVSVYVKAEQKNVSEFVGPQGQNEAPPGSPFEFFFRQFGTPQGGQNTKPEPQISRAQGSGFFISANGYVLTNNHVVDHAKSVEIMTTDGKRYHAKVAGVDPQTDLALLKVQGGSDFPFVKFASAPPRIGDWVLAMGNPFGLGGTVTAGIVSASGRDIGSGPYDDFIQIDAPVNSGNSGGPTFNLKGEVVGVNTAIFTPSGGSVGIAFDIPAETAKSISQQLEQKGTIVRGWIGVEIQPVTADIADSLGLKDATGALVDKPQDGSPAAKAGLRSQDVILSVDGQTVKDARDLARKIAAESPGRTVDLVVFRNGKQQTLDLTVGSYPNGQTAENTPSGESDNNLGLTLAPADDVAGAGSRGAVVLNVDPDGAAADQGIQQGDVILEIGGKSVSGPQDVSKALREARKDSKRAILMQLKTAQGDRFVAVPTGEG
jgi:serine protease Do